MSITVLGDPNVNISGPPTVCLQDTVNFSVNFYPDTYYSWTTDVPGGAVAYQDTSNNEMNIAFTEVGNYTFEVSVLNECGSGDDEISINVIESPSAEASPDTSLVCVDGSTQLSAQTGANYSFQWFEGEEEIGTTSTITVTPDGPTEYYLEVTGTGNCTAFDTVFVDVVYPDPPTQLYDSLCPGGLIEIDLISPIPGLYAWEDGGNGPVMMVNDVGTYALSVSPVDSICPEFYEFIIEPLVPDSAILLIDSVCPGGQGLNPITLVSPQTGEYYWSTESNLPQINVNDTGIYVLQVVMPDSLCPLTYQWTVSPDTCYAPPELFFYVPNSFSPNGDEINDVFGPVFSDPSLVSTFKFTIFDRWGEVVFQTTDVNKVWIGDFRTGEYFVHDGAYIWMIEYEQWFVADKIKEYGHVVMLR
jgi:gliding motility-associated-like protein